MKGIKCSPAIALYFNLIASLKHIDQALVANSGHIAYGTPSPVVTNRRLVCKSFVKSTNGDQTKSKLGNLTVEIRSPLQ